MRGPAALVPARLDDRKSGRFRAGLTETERNSPKTGRTRMQIGARLWIGEAVDTAGNQEIGRLKFLYALGARCCIGHVLSSNAFMLLVLGVLRTCYNEIAARTQAAAKASSNKRFKPAGTAIEMGGRMTVTARLVSRPPVRRPGLGDAVVPAEALSAKAVLASGPRADRCGSVCHHDPVSLRQRTTRPPR